MIQKIAFVGAGSMAEAIIAGIVEKKFLKPEQINVTNKSSKDKLDRLHQKYGVVGSANKEAVIKDADVIVLSMKPKDVTESLKEIKAYIKPEQLVVSILAGVPTDYISQELNSATPVVRTMPNTSATIGYSATAIAAGSFANEYHVSKIVQLFETIGTTTVVEEEDLHAVTAISGSGPAYIYYLVEAMEEAAKEAGLDRPVAKELIVQTLVGAAEMLKTTKEEPSELRRRITSPGGTTQAGIETLASYDYQEAIKACVKKAANRSKELGKPFQS
ncbi:pyrroline-5-carboxylate reductase [Aquibacillus albus]|uniref:Pyrroline-5-carboxylate reductase n=1 Tax=Aquibacillus albus TaxID=1168171 RepID=A0ABS2N371_9BACI|nr:pyrroline-5-carboxylate reductase [Aquibacillus albus]MBM7572498.1 pyrroline-5-carboxylate reductase [Aquibacillus albus]